MNRTSQDRLALHSFLRITFIFTTFVTLLASGLSRARAEETKPAASGSKKPLNVVIFLYDRMTAMDAIGPYEVFRLVPGVNVRFAAKKAGLVRTDSGLQMLNAEYGIADIHDADVLVVPGGDPSGPMRDPEVLQWFRDLNAKTKWTTSVCSGSLALGAAGLLKGLEATSHWNTIDALPSFGAKPVHKRYVRQGKILTSAGVSAGIDMSLGFVALEFGDEMAKTVQLLIEYDPQPPFDTGSTSKAPPAMVAKARERLRDIYAPAKP